MTTYFSIVLEEINYSGQAQRKNFKVSINIVEPPFLYNIFFAATSKMESSTTSF
jgi:hypothetical protein